MWGQLSTTLVFGLWYSSCVGVAGSRIWSPCLIVPGKDASGPRDGGIRTSWIWSISPTQVWVWLLRNVGFYGLWCETERMCSVFTATLTDNLIFDCLLTSMAAVQAEHVRASFFFCGWFEGHHQEWLGSTTTNRHGVAEFDFATVSGCDQLVVGPTHARGGTLDLMTDVPDLVRVSGGGWMICHF